MQCKRAHLSCSDVRPCERCVAKHIAHLCDDNSLKPDICTFTEDEMQTISGILGVGGYDLLQSSEEYNFSQAASELDYTNIFLQDPAAFLCNKNRSYVTPQNPTRAVARVSSLPPTTNIVNNNTPKSTATNPTSNASTHVHMVHGIIVNQPPSRNIPFPIPPPAPAELITPLPPPSSETNRIKNVKFVHTPEEALSLFYDYPPTWYTPTPLTPSPPSITATFNDGDYHTSTSPTTPSPTSAATASPTLSLSTISPPSPEYQEAIASALTLRLEDLQSQVSKLEETQAKLQQALQEKDQQMVEMQKRQQQENAKLRILVQCRIIPQALDTELVARARSYGIMTALYDIGAGRVMDYNKNFGKMLEDVYGPILDATCVKMPPGPMECVENLLHMMVRDYFKENLEKYTYIRMPNGEKLPFLFNLIIQCWERPAGPVVNFTYWI